MNAKTLKTALGPLYSLYQNADVREIMVEAPGKITCTDRDGTRTAKVTFKSNDHLMDHIERIFALVGRDKESIGPVADIRLADGTKVTTFLPPVSVGGPVLFLRKMWNQSISWKNLLDWKCLDRDGEAVLRKILASGENILLGGNWGSGKTSFTGLLVDSLPDDCRVICVEPNAELVVNHPRCLRLEANPASSWPMEKLIKAAVELVPDVLVLQMLTGPETMTALDVMRVGCRTLATVHASGSIDALARVEQMALMSNLSLALSEIRSVVASSIRYVVCIERYPDGVRRVAEVVELAALENDRYRLCPIYGYNSDSGKFELHPAGRKSPIVQDCP